MKYDECKIDCIRLFYIHHFSLFTDFNARVPRLLGGHDDGGVY